MSRKRVQLYASDDVLREFYRAVSAIDTRSVDKIHIPKSDVFYVRALIEQDTGVRYSLDHVERARFMEGMLTRRDVLDPDRKRGYGE